MVLVSESRSCFTSSWKQTKRNKDPWQALTYSQLLSEDGAFTQRRAVPAAVSELVLAFVDAQLCPLSDHDDGVRPALADGALAGCETGDLIADDVRTKGHHRGKSPVGQKRQTQLVKMDITCIIANGGTHIRIKQLSVSSAFCPIIILTITPAPKNYQKWDLYSILWALLKMGEHFYLSN